MRTLRSGDRVAQGVVALLGLSSLLAFAMMASDSESRVCSPDLPEPGPTAGF